MPASSIGPSENGQEYSIDKKTLLDVVLNGQKAHGQESCSRLVYTASLAKRDNSEAPYAAWSEDVISAATDGTMEGVTGIMVVYPTCLMQLLEAPPSVLHHIMQQLASTSADDSNIATSRVLLCAEGCTQRCFNGRLAGYVNSSSGSAPAAAGAAGAEAQDGFPDVASFVAATGQVVKALMSMGTVMSDLSEVALQQHLEALPTYHPEVPAADTISGLATCSVAPSVAQHLHIYSSAQKLPLARERCWPAPAAVPAFLMEQQQDSAAA